ncbi:MAG: hypothetical protein HQK60_17190 [Deltaproteobacteria bacterium]|nr:hypothetical protein [Deltaproteobacteria bacterium]
MGILDRLLSARGSKTALTKIDQPKSFLVFMDEAVIEIDELIKQNDNWYHELPYRGAVSRDRAREIEIEKRAIWRRVIYDAKRTHLKGLKWETSGDNKVCEFCRQREGEEFLTDRFDELNSIICHIGCRCNLIPIR